MQCAHSSNQILFQLIFLINLQTVRIRIMLEMQLNAMWNTYTRVIMNGENVSYSLKLYFYF